MKKQLIILAGIALIAACSPSMKTTSSWTNKEAIGKMKDKSYKTVFVSVITSKLEFRTKLEEYLSNAVEKRGLKAIKSIDKFPPAANAKLSQDQIMGIIKDAGADAIFTTAVVDKQTEQRYVPGTTYGGFYGYYGAAWGYGSPGYYTTDKTYFLESNLFDVETQTVLWSSQSEAYNPSSIESSARQYTELMVAQLEKDGLLKKQVTEKKK